MPHRDLLLSPDHEIFADGVLIPIRQPVNGGTIARVASPALTWFHLELLTHDVLSLERLPAVSRLDPGENADRPALCIPISPFEHGALWAARR